MLFPGKFAGASSLPYFHLAGVCVFCAGSNDCCTRLGISIRYHSPRIIAHFLRPVREVEDGCSWHGYVVIDSLLQDTTLFFIAI